ncbi:MAG: GC-type dockerin domain-anchored protein [Phycisphaerales bacterium JB039]
MSKCAFVGGALGFLLAMASPALGQRAQQAVDDLLRDHPGARVHWAGAEPARASIIFGAPMTTGATPREAAENFLYLYGEAFSDGDLELEQIREFNLHRGRTVFGYRQLVDGVPVDASIVRVMVRADRGSDPTVVYAAGHFARPPAGGLPAPSISAEQALRTAMAHPRAETLVDWAEPQLVVTTPDGALSRADGRAAWKLVGWSDLRVSVESYAFWVDAQTGALLRYADLVARSFPPPQPSVTGTVTGGATQGTKPDKGVGHRCGSNLPQTSPLPQLKVEITNAAQTQVLDSKVTDDNGVYKFFGTNYPADAKIRFTWSGPAWELLEGACPSQRDPVPPAVYNLGSTFPTTRDHDFNPSPFAEFDTARVNVHRALLKARGFWHQLLPPGTYAGLDDLVNPVVNDCQFACAGRYFALVGVPDWVVYGRIASNVCDFNQAYSTVVVHEYGHYLANRMLNIPTDTDPHKDFHEGFGDTLAMLVYGVTVHAEDWRPNCDPDRSPLTATPRPEFDCATSAPHADGMLLGALWLELAAEPISGGIGPDSAHQLFVDWAMLTSGGVENGPEGCESDPKAAGPATLVEVLTADDDDADLSNGTPHRTAICQIFSGRGIESTPGVGLCTESAGGSSPCPPDVNGDSALDVFDFLLMQNWLSAGDVRADWDGDGRVGGEDLAAYAVAFAGGC